MADNSATPDVRGMVNDPQFRSLEPTQQREALYKLTKDGAFSSLSDADTGAFISRMTTPSATSSFSIPSLGLGDKTTITPKASAATPDAQPAGYERFMHAAGLPAHLNEVTPMIKGLLHPEASPTDPGFGQTIPVLGPAFSAQRETYDKPGWGKVYGSIPLVGPPGYQMGEALANKDYPAAAGSALNIVTQLAGLRGTLTKPGSLAEAIVQAKGKTPEALQALRQAGTPVQVPYTKEGVSAPGVAVTKAPRTWSLGGMIAKDLGLSSEYGDRVASRVEQMQKLRDDAKQDLLGRWTQASKTQEQLTDHEQGALTNVQKQLESEISNAQQAAGMQISNIREGAQQQIATAQGQIQNLEGQRLEAGRQLIADTAKAVFEEHARVQKPFIEIGQAITRPIADAEHVRQIITDAATGKNVQGREIPAAAYKAMPEGSAAPVRVNGMQVSAQQLPESIRSLMTPQELGVQPLTFNDLTRIQDDLHGVAGTSKDGAVRATMYEAAKAVNKLREQAADDAGLGDKFRAAKRDYSNFMRGAGSDMVQKWLSAKDVEEQAITPKLAQLTNRSSAEALRTILNSLKVDVTPLDQIIQDISGTKAAIKETGRTAETAVRGTKADLAARIADIKRGTAEKRQSIASDTALETKLNQRDLVSDWRDVQSEAREGLAESQDKGRIVPNRTNEDLAGLSTSQINQMRMRALMTNMRAAGISNPSGLILLGYGLARLMFGSPRGAIVAAYGGLKMGAPVLMGRLITDPRFQNWIFRTGGIVPDPGMYMKLRRGLGEMTYRTPMRQAIIASARTAASQR